MMDDIMNRVQDHFEESLTMFDESRIAADSAIANVTATADAFCEKVGKTFDTEVDTLLDDVQYNIVKTALKGEILSD